MKIKILFVYLSVLASLTLASTITYYKFFKKAPPKLFTTTMPKLKAISQNVSASGILSIKNPIKIGSLVSGTVKELYVTENQFVKKGDVLAIIDPGTSDTEFQKAFYEHEKTRKEFEYTKNNFERKKKLYQANQLSKDEYERLSKELDITELNLKKAKINLEKEQLYLNNRKIVAIQDGFITAVNTTKGAGVSGVEVSNSCSELFIIAPNITQMEAKLDIDASDIGLIKPDLPVSFTVSTYPDKVSYTKIRDIGFSPKISNDSAFYKASVDIDNETQLFRPGMTIHAKIKVAKSKSTLCINGIAFQINGKMLEKIAKQLEYNYQPIKKRSKKEYRNSRANQRVKTVWIEQDKNFIEKQVILGITDNNYFDFEILEGLTANDKIIIDIVEDDVMQNIYKKWFKGPL
ncbi:MAG: efflux RND transporter periplasmic adaptor subunit [bacterium]